MTDTSPTSPAPGGNVPAIVPGVLILTSSASILSTDLYAPSLPHLPAVFATDASTVQLTMSLNVLAFALAQLVHGPLADRFGRRPVLLCGMAAFGLCSLACALATSVDALIWARVLQGIAASSEAVVVLAVIRDLYAGPAAVRIMGFYGMTIALAPAVGPVIGGYMHVWFGWRSNFALLACFTAVVFALVWRFLPESTVPDRGALAPGRLAAAYAGQMAQRRFIAYAAVLGAVMAALFAFITAAPFLLIDSLGVATQHFGYYQAVIVLTYFLGSLMAARAVDGLGIEPMLRFGLVLVVAGTGAVPWVVWSGLLTAATVTAALAIYAFGLGLVFATAPMRAMEAATGGLGVAAALLGSFEMVGAGLGSVAVSALYDGSAWPLAISVAGFGALAGIFYVVLKPWRGA